MRDFEEIYRANETKIRALAETNTQRNAAGQTVISRDDPWFYEDEWDDYYKELIARSKIAAKAALFVFVTSILSNSVFATC